jgi:hypothetical protein
MNKIYAYLILFTLAIVVFGGCSTLFYQVANHGTVFEKQSDSIVISKYQKDHYTPQIITWASPSIPVIIPSTHKITYWIKFNLNDQEITHEINQDTWNKLEKDSPLIITHETSRISKELSIKNISPK